MRTNFTFFLVLICGQLLAQTPAWRQLPGPAGASVSQLERDGNDLYAVTTNTVLKSSDGGQTWARTPIERKICQQIHQFKADGGRFYCILDNQDIVRSLDGGLTWTVIFKIPLLVFLSSDVRLLVQGDTLVNIFEFQVNVSTNNGDTWTASLVPIDPSDLSGFCATSNEIFIAGYNDVYRSGNGGKTWEKVFASSFPVGLLEAVGDVLYLKYEGYGRLVRSADGFRTWSVIDVPVWNNVYDGPDRFVGEGDTLFWMPRLLWGGQCELPFFKSTDGGKTWQSDALSLTNWSYVQSVAYLSGSLLVSSGYSLERSTDGGETFQSIQLTSGQTQVQDIFRVKQRLWASTAGGYFYSDDEGETWQTAQMPSQNCRSTELANAGERLFFSTQEPFAYWYSDDNGSTWTNTNLELPAATMSLGANERGAYFLTDYVVVSRLPSTGAPVLAQDGVLLGIPSNETPASWLVNEDKIVFSYYADTTGAVRLLIFNIEDLSVEQLDFRECGFFLTPVLLDDEALVVQCQEGNFYQYDLSEKTWRRWFPIDWTFGGALYNEAFNLFQQQERLWLGNAQGLYFSWDGSGRFVPFEPRLPEGVFPASLLVEEDKIWVGTYSDGLFVIEKPFVRPEDVGRRNFRLSPNPSVGPLRLQSDVLPTRPGTLRVFDATGRMLVEDNLWPALSWEYDFSHLPAGFYFLQMQTELGRESLRWVKR